MNGGQWQLQTSIMIAGTKVFLGTTASLPFTSNPQRTQALPYGTGQGTIDANVAMDLRTLAAGASETFNLYDGSLLDIYGDAAGMRILRAYAIGIISGGDQSGVTIGGAGSNPHPLFFGGTNPTKTVFPSSPFDGGISPVGVAITSTQCNVKVTNNGLKTVNYGIWFSGSRAVSGAAMGGGIAGLTYP